LGDWRVAFAPGAPPCGVSERAFAAFQHQHLVRWLDPAIPVPGGQTPSPAPGEPGTHPKLEHVLRKMENAEDRKRTAGEDWHDLGWLRAELGMG